MLRFRNRFKATQSEIHTCRCGARMSVSGPVGAQTVIHAFPFCPAFEAALAKMAASDPNAVMYRAAILPETGETIVLADGERMEDVDHTDRPTEVWVDPEGEYRVVVGEPETKP